VTQEFRSRSYPADKAKKKADALLQISLDRLVFLAQREHDAYGFELRSFQEYWAAAALTTGETSDVRPRLDRIAPASSWRNVLLFAVGRAAHGASMVNEVAITLCKSLDDPERDADSAAGLGGALLALDLLEDGARSTDLGAVQSFLDSAVRVLDALDPTGHARLGRVLATLAADAKDLAIPVLETALLSRLNSTGTEARLAALLCLAAWLVATPDASPFADMLREALRDDPRELEELIVRLQQEGLALDGRITSRCDELRGQLNWLGPAFHFWRIAEDSDSLPPRMRAISHVLTRNASALSLVSDGSIVGQGWLAGLPSQDAADSLRLMAISVVNDPALNDAPAAPIRAVATFQAEPNAEGLARALEILAATEPMVAGIHAIWRMPWPLGYCVGNATTTDELLRMAAQARAGEFGSESSWRHAESRWLTEGISVRDLELGLSQTLLGHVHHEGIPLICLRYSSQMTAFQPAIRERLGAYASSLVQMLDAEGAFWNSPGFV
jgi:hypothetical protein